MLGVKPQNALHYVSKLKECFFATFQLTPDASCFFLQFIGTLEEMVEELEKLNQ